MKGKLSCILMLFLILMPTFIFAAEFEPATKILSAMYASIEPLSTGKYRYRYKLENKSSSEQDIWALALEYEGEISKVMSPDGWDGGGVVGKKVVNWSAGGDETPFDPTQINKITSPYFIKPQMSKNGFGVESLGIPGFVTYFVQGFTLPPIVQSEKEAPLDEEIPDFFQNSVKGKTVGPTRPPADFKALDFINYIVSMKHEAYKLGWLKSEGIVKSLDAKLDNAKKDIERGNVRSAKNTLKAFINEVEAQGCESYENCLAGKNLTSEAYGLLKYNAQYLIDHL